MKPSIVKGPNIDVVHVKKHESNGAVRTSASSTDYILGSSESCGIDEESSGFPSHSDPQ